MTSESTDVMHCPACNAKQFVSPICRRCKCDLNLVMTIMAQERKLHAGALRFLSTGECDNAIHMAKERWRLAPGEDAARLLAVCYIKQGRFRAAFDVFTEFLNCRGCETLP